MTTKLRINTEDPIIMVDDSEDDALIAQRCYERSGLKNPFKTLGSGRDLIRYLESVLTEEAPMPAIVLLDINMPGMSGFETLDNIRSRDAFAEVPIIMMLTNSDDPKDIEKSTKLGANGFQTKPLGLADYVAFFKSLTE